MYSNAMRGKSDWRGKSDRWRGGERQRWYKTKNAAAEGERMSLTTVQNNNVLLETTYNHVPRMFLVSPYRSRYVPPRRARWYKCSRSNSACPFAFHPRPFTLAAAELASVVAALSTLEVRTFRYSRAWVLPLPLEETRIRYSRPREKEREREREKGREWWQRKRARKETAILPHSRGSRVSLPSRARAKEPLPKGLKS